MSAERRVEVEFRCPGDHRYTNPDCPNCRAFERGENYLATLAPGSYGAALMAVGEAQDAKDACARHRAKGGDTRDYEEWRLDFDELDIAVYAALDALRAHPDYKGGG